ncbi:MAG: ion transporter [Bacteroidales bacterium]|nr:ion transporter [Bacteroidales bacterium]
MNNKFRQKLFEIIFESDTRSGKVFDIALLFFILLSIVIVILESVSGYQIRFGHIFLIIEWFITILFTLEYITRIYVVDKPWKYIFSFYGIIDLISILPTFISVFIPGTHSLMVIRALRLLRIFRILKITRYIDAGKILVNALKASRIKISVFLFTIGTVIVIIGTLMYLIEGEASGFTSIPKSIYWAVVTLTTVGYGDITPQTAFGQFISSLVMILGYSIIAVPTGIVTAELAGNIKKSSNNQVCPKCLKEGHDEDAEYCKYCGSELNKEK